MNRYRVFLLVLCALLIFSGCSQSEQLPPQEPVPPQSVQLPESTVSGSDTPNVVEPENTLSILLEQYESDGWVWVSSITCQHGDPFFCTDVTGERPSSEGTTETLHFCCYQQKEFTP